MIPVYQTIHGPDGNCYAACVATLLGRGIGAVPDLRGDPKWGERLNRYLNRRGLRARFVRDTPRGPAIASVRTLTGGVHAVVCYGGRIVHDPSPRPLAHADNPVVLWTVIERQPTCSRFFATFFRRAPRR